jgi:hypothetical protein
MNKETQELPEGLEDDLKDILQRVAHDGYYMPHRSD